MTQTALRSPRSMFQSQSTRDCTEKIVAIPLDELYPFANHPYKVLDNEDMDELVESIKLQGVTNPAIVRERSAGGYELISGHRRHHACQIAGLETLPAVVRDLDDDAATIIMVNCNEMHRAAILPSEYAFAYKMRMEAIGRKQGERNDLTCTQVGYKSLKSADIIAEQVGSSRNQVQRYIRLTYLIQDLLDNVDNKSLPFNVGVELSFLSHDEQCTVLDVMQEKDLSPSIAQAQRMKRFALDANLTAEAVLAILTEEKPSKRNKVTLERAEFSEYFPEEYTMEQIKDWILEMMKKERCV